MPAKTPKPGAPPAPRPQAKAKPKQRTYFWDFLLTALLYLLASFVAWWCVNRLTYAAITGAGQVSLFRDEVVFILAYLYIAVLPAIFRRYAIAQSILAGALVWRLYLYANVLKTKTYDALLDLFHPLFYITMGAALTIGLTAEIGRHLRAKREAGEEAAPKAKE